jgi:hypothetical protein
MLKHKKIKYVITSAVNYTKALNIFLESLFEEGIKEEDIIIVYAKSDKSEISFLENKKILTIHTKYNLYEFTSIAGLIQAFKAQSKNLVLNPNLKIDFEENNYLLLHDTCKALHGFKNKVELFNGIMNNSAGGIDIIWCNESGKHNIGMFNWKAIKLAFQNSISKIIFGNSSEPFDKTFAVKMEWDLCPESLHLLPCNHFWCQEHTLVPWYIISNIYGKHKPRQIAYFTSINLVKYYVQLGPVGPGVGLIHPNSV